MTAAPAEILLVDDTPENLRVLSDLLRSHGHLVRVASGGAMALRSVEIRRPDLILLDIRMPEMDGFEVCRRLRADHGRLGIPILFLSASDSPADRVQAFQVGGEDFISKPFQSDEVLARVSTHLALARVRRELDLANAQLAGEVAVQGRLRDAAEQTAVERGVRLELTLAAASLGAWDVDLGSETVSPDQRARQILGLQPGDRPHWRDLLICLGGSEAVAAWDRTLAAQTPFELEGRVGGPGNGADGQRRIRLRGRPLPAGSGSPARIAGVVWDVTEESQLRERLVRAERMESLGMLAGGVAHDFNNQLSVIMGALELLSLTGAGGPAAAPHLANIAAAAESSASLVRDLLAYARHREVEHATVDLAALVAQAARLAARSLGTDISLETAFPGHPVWVSGNRGQLENAVLNLAINARDAMSGGGRLCIAVAEQDVAGALSQATGVPFSGRFAIVSVTDTGSGIPEAILGRIFEPFFTTKPEGKGNGLGLAAVLGCVAGHGGHLTVDSAPGRGTTFAIHLPPATAPPRPVPAPEVAGTTSRRQAARLLLIDDQDSVREVVANGLRHLGWEIESYADPRAAVAAWVPEAAFAAALVDLAMPCMSGAAVFRELRRRDPTATVLLMSGNAGGAGENVDDLRREGLAGFVAKPVRLRELDRLLRELTAKGTP